MCIRDSLYSGHNDHNYFEIAHNVRRLEAVGKSLYTFVDNHDEDRIASKLNHPANLFPVYQLLFTLPGIPSIYYGSEWGIEGKRSRTSDEVLRPALTLSLIHICLMSSAFPGTQDDAPAVFSSFHP